jgi:murein DD-endopeptidase MepM/ murein hydrolase activator NlpD
VIQAGYTTVGYGNMVVVDHGNGYQTLYAHMNKIYVEVGQTVAKGELVGECGATGGYRLPFAL